MFGRKRKQYVILVLSPKIGYFAEIVGKYTSSQKSALKLSKKDARALHKDLLYLSVPATILEYDGGEVI